MKHLYSKQHLSDALKKASLPASNPSILLYRRLGVIQDPVHVVHFKDRTWRFYTQEEIDDNVERVRKHLGK